MRNGIRKDEERKMQRNPKCLAKKKRYREMKRMKIKRNDEKKITRKANKRGGGKPRIEKKINSCSSTLEQPKNRALSSSYTNFPTHNKRTSPSRTQRVSSSKSPLSNKIVLSNYISEYEDVGYGVVLRLLL